MSKTGRLMTAQGLDTACCASYVVSMKDNAFIWITWKPVHARAIISSRDGAPDIGVYIEQESMVGSVAEEGGSENGAND